MVDTTDDPLCPAVQGDRTLTMQLSPQALPFRQDSQQAARWTVRPSWDSEIRGQGSDGTTNGAVETKGDSGWPAPF